MHELSNGGSEQQQTRFLRPLLILLENGDDYLGDGGGVDTAELLYETISNNASTEEIRELMDRAALLKKDQPAAYRDIYNAINSYTSEEAHEHLKEEFKISHAAIIEAVTSPSSAYRSANAVHLAYRLGAWNLADSVRAAYMKAEPSIYHNESGHAYQLLIFEINDYFGIMREEINPEDVFEEEEDGSAAYPVLTSFSDTVNALDLDGFNDEMTRKEQRIPKLNIAHLINSLDIDVDDFKNGGKE